MGTRVMHQVSTAFVQVRLPVCKKRPRSTFTCSASDGRRNASSTSQRDGGKVSRGFRILEAPYAFGYVVQTARFVWRNVWKAMMSELAPSTATGAYARPASQFARGAEGSLSNDMVLFYGSACQWCHRTMLARTLLRIEDRLPAVPVQPGDDGLWKFEGLNSEIWGKRLREVYMDLEPEYRGRFTAPLLIDKAKRRIVSNESSDILRILPIAFMENSNGPRPVEGDPHAVVWLRPPRDNEFGVDVDDLARICDQIYFQINNGVYRCGFATSQKAYEDAIRELFEGLDEMENRLQRRRFVCSSTVITEADLRLFPTVFRFDAIYAVLFKACKKTIRADYPAIAEWMKGKAQIPNLLHIC